MMIVMMFIRSADRPDIEIEMVAGSVASDTGAIRADYGLTDKTFSTYAPLR